MENKYNLTLEQNTFLAKRNIIDNIYAGARMEEINVTFLQVKKILEGINVPNLKIDEILFVENSNVYTLLKSHYKIPLLDFYFESLDLRENIQEYKVKWGEQGHEVFTANSYKYKFSNLVLDLIEKLEPIRKALL